MDPLYADLLRERFGKSTWWVTTRPVIHRFANFLLSTGAPACGTPKTQVRTPETQATHRPPTYFPQVRIRFCEQLGGP